MVDGLYPANAKTTKLIALIITLSVALTNLGVLGQFINLASIGFNGISLLYVFGSFGLLWIAYGIHKNKFH